MHPVPPHQKASRLDFAKLPRITFVTPDGESAVALGSRVDEIAARAQLLGARLAPGSAVGLVFRSGPALVLNWLACLAARLEPLVMQYPTEKQTREYWETSVRHTTRLADLKAIVAEDAVAGRIKGLAVAMINGSEFENAVSTNRPAALILGEEFSILQLSSGTTGFRKGIRFTGRELFRHAADYDEALRLDPGRDVIVSWLPLYHDMGYIACFVMPLLLGVPIVMMDPMDWVRNPAMLFAAIRRHSGSVCYMPNFGFEVMSRVANREAMPSMRCWISCSEPVSAATMEKFRNSTGAAPETLAACYAMAENVFAVSQSRGMATRQINGIATVSCGRLIAGCEAKIVKGEIWVRSPASLSAYLGGGDIRDRDGYYATGDLGALIEGELYVTGRKQDLLIQAGRKFMLSDLDLLANRLIPDAKGRVACVAAYDETAATQKPHFLVESDIFFKRDDASSIADTLKRNSGVEFLELSFVPPGFITKTSSGKINRGKTLADWTAVRKAAEREHESGVSLRDDLRSEFATANWGKPVGVSLDSLAHIVLRLLLDEHGVSYDPKKSLEEIAAASSEAAAEDGESGLSVVCLGDSRAYAGIADRHLEVLERLVGQKIQIHHVCAPPSPVLFSDIVFHDYIMPRAPGPEYRHFASAIRKIKRASFLIVDDVSEIHFPLKQVYGVLSHRLEREPEADFIGVRWQRYAQGHADLPCAVASGVDFPPSTRNQSLENLSLYLRKPIFKVALVKPFEPMTEGWDFEDRRSTNGTKKGLRPVHGGKFARGLARWILDHEDEIKPARGIGANEINLIGLPHFCSWFIRKKAIDLVLDRYGSFCLAGGRASVPYVEKRLHELGKPFSRIPSHAAQWLKSVDDFECLLVLGAQGALRTNKPAFAPMYFGPAGFTANLEDEELQGMEIRRLSLHTSPHAFYGVPVERGEGRKLRNAVGRIADRKRDAGPAAYDDE